jgi:arylsulfatase A-like enzyme
MLAAVSLADAHLASGPRIRPGTAAMRDAYLLGQLLAAGVVAYAAVALWRRFGPRSRLAAYAAVLLVTLAITVPSLDEDLAILAGKLPIPYAVAHRLLIASVAAAVPLAALLGRLLARPWLRGTAVVVAVGCAIANHLVLPDDYAGMHLVAAMAAATLGGVALATADAPAGSRSSALATGLLAVVSAATVLVTPKSSVALAIFRVPGDVVAPWLARLRDRLDVDGGGGERDLADLDPAHAEWWKSRAGHAPVPASTPSILPASPIVILITIDCMRANLITDEPRGVPLPSMEELRRESIQFTQARATAPATAQSIGSIFSGRFYSELFWKPWPGASVESVYPYEDEAPRFPDLLARAGVDTVTFSGMPGLVNKYGVVRGFKEERVLRSNHYAAAHTIMEPAIKRLRKQGDKPMFLYLHFTDAHAPYDHAGPKGSAWDRYLRGLALVDAELGDLFEALGDEPGLRERTSVFLSADHGEAFGEHHQFFHATSLYDELLRVPLLMHVPGVAARKVDKRVSLIDLAPTILDLFGLPTPGELMGQSLVPYFRGEDPALTRPIVADSSRLMRALIFPDGFKVIHDRRRGTVELYDLNKDPRELHELLDQGGAGADGDARLRTLSAFFRTHTLKRDGYRVPYGR